MSAFIDRIVATIRSARYGRDVRESIAQGIEAIDDVAEGARDSATTSATAAQGYAQAADQSASNAHTSEVNAGDSATIASNKATLSESWAVGGTDTRSGEDTNNSKYWAEYAQTTARGVEYFNGRQGVVTPQANDYSLTQIGTDSASQNSVPIVGANNQFTYVAKGGANGVASLDANGRIPYAQLPESAMEFKGTWNASTNTPTLTAGVGTNGDFYVVSVGGTWHNMDFNPNDRIIFDGVTAHDWVKLIAGEVNSVNGYSGDVVLDSDDISYDTSNSVQDKISALDSRKEFFYGTCDTSAGTEEKTVVCPDFTANDLIAGTVINVTFTNYTTANTASLNINSTGAVSVSRFGTTTTGIGTHSWTSGQTVQFTYDGTYWVITGAPYREATTSYYGMTKLSSSVTSTSTDTAATSSAVKQAYDLANRLADIETIGDGLTLTNGELAVVGGTGALVNVAPIFSTTQNYGVGDYVIYNGTTYRFTSAHTAGSWNDNDAEEVYIAGQYVTAGQKSGTTLGEKATAEGYDTTASGDESHAEGYKTTAINQYAHSEGNNTIASGRNSHAEGYNTIASKNSCHAEGDSTTASGDFTSHAEGYKTTASGDYGSHAEGNNTTASGSGSHAEGGNTVASHGYSHAEGYYTQTGASYQHVQGKYNIGKSTTLFEIGNGTLDNTRSNAFEVDTNGNVTIGGTVTDGGGRVLMAKGLDYVTAGQKSGTTLGTKATAEGYNNTASGNYSHAEGYYTQTGANYQHVQGKFNVGKSTTLFEIGNGSSTQTRSNALEVDTSGNVVAGGTITDGNGVTLNSRAASSTVSSLSTTVSDLIKFSSDTNAFTYSTANTWVNTGAKITTPSGYKCLIIAYINGIKTTGIAMNETNDTSNSGWSIEATNVKEMPYYASGGKTLYLKMKSSNTGSGEGRLYCFAFKV